MASERPISYSDGDAEILFEYKGRFYQTTKSWIAQRMEATERIDITAQWHSKVMKDFVAKIVKTKEELSDQD